MYTLQEDKNVSLISIYLYMYIYTMYIDALNNTPLNLMLIHRLYEESTPWEQNNLHRFPFWCSLVIM